MNRLSPAKQAQAEALLLKGESSYTVARLVKINKITASKIARKLGVKYDKQSG